MAEKEGPMSTPLGIILAVAALVSCVVAIVMAAAYSRYRGVWTVECPEDETTAGLRLDTKHAVLTSAIGTPKVRVKDCSHWPERAGCSESCLRGEV
jgi:hypothetical protein